MRIVAAGRSQIGSKQVNNEDAFIVDLDTGFFGVTDGISEHAAGQVAASVALEGAFRAVRHRPWVTELISQGSSDIHAAMDLLERAVDQANADVWTLAQERSAYRDMGCTLTALLAVEDQAALASVGDSRFYLCQRGRTEQLTIDHTPAEEFRRQGEEQFEVPAALRYSRSLSRAIGLRQSVRADVFPITFEVGDRFVICTDGLNQALSETPNITDVILGGDVEMVADRLVELATASGAMGDITVVVGALEE